MKSSILNVNSTFGSFIKQTLLQYTGPGMSVSLVFKSPIKSLSLRPLQFLVKTDDIDRHIN